MSNEIPAILEPRDEAQLAQDLADFEAQRLAFRSSSIMACRTGCPTQDHESYWHCLQDAAIAVDKSSLRP